MNWEILQYWLGIPVAALIFVLLLQRFGQDP
jgi:hypothetical protein